MNTFTFTLRENSSIDETKPLYRTMLLYFIPNKEAKKLNVEFANQLFNLANFLFIAGSTSLIIDFVKNPIKYKLWSVSLTLSAMLEIYGDGYSNEETT